MSKFKIILTISIITALISLPLVITAYAQEVVFDESGSYTNGRADLSKRAKRNVVDDYE